MNHRKTKQTTNINKTRNKLTKPKLLILWLLYHCPMPPFSSFISSLLLLHNIQYSFAKTRSITIARALINRIQRLRGILYSTPDIYRIQLALYFIL